MTIDNEKHSGGDEKRIAIFDYSIQQVVLFVGSITLGAVLFSTTAATSSSLVKNIKISWLPWSAEDVVAFLCLILFLSLGIFVLRTLARKSDLENHRDSQEYFSGFARFIIFLCAPTVFSICVLYIASHLNGIVIPLLYYSLSSFLMTLGKAVLIASLIFALYVLKWHPSAKLRELSFYFLLGWFLNATNHFLVSIR